MPLDPRPHTDVLRPERRQLLIALALGACLTTLILLSGRHSIGTGADPSCEALDAPASEAVARLVHAHASVSQTRLGDAVFRLRRARKNCRHGFAGLARNDYNALLNGQFDRSR